MDNSEQGATINRVLIVLDAPLQDQGLLELAVALAANRRVELVTLFIEDQELFHLASLPFSQEIDRVSARVRKLDSLQITRTLRAQALEIGKTLERLTRQPGVSHSLKIVRGRYMNAVLSAVTGMEVVFLRKEIGNYKIRRRGQPFDMMTAQPRAPGKHNAVWIIFDGTAGSRRALLTARDIAQADNRDLVIVVRAPDANAAAELRRQADPLIRDQALQALYTFVPETDDEVLVRQLENGACGLLVMHRAAEPVSEALTGLLLRELECPLVLVP